MKYATWTYDAEGGHYKVVEADSKEKAKEMAINYHDNMLPCLRGTITDITVKEV